MSILNINESTSDSGIKKTIDRGSQDVALDILQRGIYAYPVKSTVRELVSNAYDANIERETAKRILNGIDQVEDHYDVTKVDGVYHSSGWDPDYYNIDYLSDDANVYLFYEEGIQRDTMRIKDNGIGLGKSRLVGYFQLAYSSKRTQKGALGKWGLGNKSALSLGIDSYTVINRYNGKKFRFEVYLNNVVSVTPKFTSGKLNSFITVSVPQPMEDGSVVDKDFIFYYEDTIEQNGLELIVSVKKHEKKEFFRAIEEQLMYIPNVVFQHKKVESLSFDTIDIAAKVLYKDNNIVISETTLLNYPHILLGAGKGLINYGAIDFEALELEPKKGAVGLILDINEVEVTPSREAVVWSSKTRLAVIKSYNEIVETATKLINKELNNAHDYWDWIQKVGSIKNALVTNQASTGSVLQKLSGIIDSSSINKIYYRNHGLDMLYVSDMKTIIGEKLLVRMFKYENYGRKVVRTNIKSTNSLSGYNAYVTDGSSDKYKDRYIYQQVEKKEFIVIKRLENWNLERTSNLIGNSDKLISYDNLIVPDTFMSLYLKEEADNGVIDDAESVSIVVDANRLAKMRKLEEKILFHEPSISGTSITYSSREIKTSDVITRYSDSTVLYGSFANRDFINSIIKLFPWGMLKSVNYYQVSHSVKIPLLASIYNDAILSKNISMVDAILISKDNESHISGMNNFKHVSDYIIESYKDKKLVFNKSLRFALTHILIQKILGRYDFNSIRGDIFAEDIAKLFYTEEFLNILVINEYFKSCTDKWISPFFSHAISYEMGKDTLDYSTLKDYLSAVDKSLPEELCEKIDEIEDLHIVDVDLINRVENYCKFYSKFNPILKKISYSSDLDILEVLYPLIKDNEEFPKSN